MQHLTTLCYNDYTLHFWVSVVVDKQPTITLSLPTTARSTYRSTRKTKKVKSMLLAEAIDGLDFDRRLGRGWRPAICQSGDSATFNETETTPLRNNFGSSKRLPNI